MIKKNINYDWSFLAIKKAELNKHLAIVNSINKDTALSVLNDLQYDLLYNFDINKVKNSSYYKYMSQFNHWLNRDIDDYESIKESKLKKILEYKHWLLKKEPLSEDEYDAIKFSYLIKNTFYCFDDFWYDTGIPFIIFSKKFFDDYLGKNNFFQMPKFIKDELEVFELEQKYLGTNDFRFIGKISPQLAHKIIKEQKPNLDEEIQEEFDFFLLLLQKVIDNEIYLVILLNP